MIEIRVIDRHPDLTEAVRLQREIWGFAEIELLPVRLFVVATKVGGHVFGAFDGARMIGFLLAMSTVCPLRQNGNMRVEQGQRLHSTLDHP